MTSEFTEPEDVTAKPWKISSFSLPGGNGIGVFGLAGDCIRVGEPDNPHAPVLEFTKAEWDAFIGGVLNGEFNRRPRG